MDARPLEPLGIPQELDKQAFFEDLAQGRAVWFRAKGESMRPCLRDGDLLWLVPQDVAACRPGDLVLLREGTRFSLHRLLARRGDGLLTKGDALDTPDAPWLTTSLLARAEGRLIAGRLRSLRTPAWRLYGRVLVAVAPLSGPALGALRAGLAVLRRAGNGLGKTKE